MSRLVVWLLAITINIIFLLGFVFIVKPYVDKAAKGIAQMLCPTCEFKK